MVEVDAGESAEVVAQRIRKALGEALKETPREDLVDALAVSLSNTITLEMILHDILMAWADMSDAKRKRVITSLAHQMSLASGTEFIDVPGSLQ